jgi:hypothetical protein
MTHSSIRRSSISRRSALPPDKHFSSALLCLLFVNPGGIVNWETREGRRTVGVSIEGKF